MLSEVPYSRGSVRTGKSHHCRVRCQSKKRPAKLRQVAALRSQSPPSKGLFSNKSRNGCNPRCTRGWRPWNFKSGFPSLSFCLGFTKLRQIAAVVPPSQNPFSKGLFSFKSRKGCNPRGTRGWRPW